jgi:hypothetical protein
MDEMDKIIKSLSNKISRMEIERVKPNPYVRNQNQFRRNLNTNPHIQQRQIKNEEQKIQASFKTKNLIQGDDVQYYDELDEDINNFSDDDIGPHFTQQGYKKYLNLESLFDEKNIINLGDTTSQYKDIADSIMVELHNKYNLRTRDNNSTTNPPKKLLAWNKLNEAVVLKSTTEIQASQIKQVESKEKQTKKMENKEAEVRTKEL